MSQQQGYGLQQNPGSYQAFSSQPYGSLNQAGDNKANTSLICGIIGLVTSVLCCCIPFIGLVLGIIAWVQGSAAKKLGSMKATPGFVLGIIAVVISGLMLIFLIANFLDGGARMQEFSDYLNELNDSLEKYSY
jgi:thiol:disulfide interchange protein